MTCSMGLIDQFFGGSMAHRRVDDMSMDQKSQADDEKEADAEAWSSANVADDPAMADYAAMADYPAMRAIDRPSASAS